MSARLVRRTFASPFVVTLAAAAIPAAACYVQPASAPGHVNPPRPTRTDPAATMPVPDHGATNAGAEQARPTEPPVVIANPPRPAPVQVAKTDRTWTVTRASGTCSAFTTSSCPTVAPGQPIPPCNPPPPSAYTCLPGMADGSKVTIVQYAGQSECQIQPLPMNCPPNAMCNPPPPQKVACPR